MSDQKFAQMFSPAFLRSTSTAVLEKILEKIIERFADSNECYNFLELPIQQIDQELKDRKKAN